MPQTTAETPPRPGKRKRRASLVPEAAIQHAISDWLYLAGIPHAVTDAAVVPGEHPRVTPGWPDITGCWAGTFVAIEVKRADGQLRDEQRAVLGELEAAGAIVIVARSVEDVVEAFESRVYRPVNVGSVRVNRLYRAIDGYRKGHGAR